MDGSLWFLTGSRKINSIIPVFYMFPEQTVGMVEMVRFLLYQEFNRCFAAWKKLDTFCYFDIGMPFFHKWSLIFSADVRWLSSLIFVEKQGVSLR